MLVRGNPSITQLSALLLVPLVAITAYAGDVAAGETRGTLKQVDGVRFLLLSGTPYDRGVAHGYHLAKDIVTSLEQFIASRGVVAYKGLLMMSTKRMSASREYRQELEGMLQGIRNKLNALPVIKPLARAITFDDLLTMNCIADALALGCSSFAAWGSLTTDGNTLAGRNLDWELTEAMFGPGLVVAYPPDPVRSALGWVSITWPGLIGCYTGMNSEGVTVSIHDVAAGRASDDDGFVPRTFVLRDAIEAAHAATAVDDIKRVLRSRAVMVGNNVAVTMPYNGDASPSVVFEYDGHTAQSAGVTVRSPTESMHQVCTNHYVKRARPTACSRFDTLSKRLALADRKRTQLGVDDAWGMLRAVAFAGQRAQEIVTYTSVVFEPNERKMHVAFATRSLPAPHGKRVSVDVARLLLEATRVGNSK